jgi:hypothetical protein
MDLGSSLLSQPQCERLFGQATCRELGRPDPATARKAQVTPGMSTVTIYQSVAHATWVNNKIDASDGLSWRGAVGSTSDASEFLMLLLLDDGRIVPGASSETALDQQLMQLSQSR